MRSILFFTTIFCLINCAARKRYLNHYLSTEIENIKIFPANKKDSVRTEEIDVSIEKSLEKCKTNKNLDCIDDRGIMTLHAEFPKGIYNFRKVLFENFKISKNATIGENRIRLTIGTTDNLENINVLKYTDDNTKKNNRKYF